MSKRNEVVRFSGMSIAGAKAFFDDPDVRRILGRLPEVPVVIKDGTTEFGQGGRARAVTASERLDQLGVRMSHRIVSKLVAGGAGHSAALVFSEYDDGHTGPGKVDIGHYQYRCDDRGLSEQLDSCPEIMYRECKLDEGVMLPPQIDTEKKLILIYWTPCPVNYWGGPEWGYLYNNLLQAIPAAKRSEYQILTFHGMMPGDRPMDAEYVGCGLMPDFVSIEPTLPITFLGSPLSRAEFDCLLHRAVLVFAEGWNNVQVRESLGKPFVRFGENFPTFFNYKYLPKSLVMPAFQLTEEKFSAFQVMHESYLQVIKCTANEFGDCAGYINGDVRQWISGILNEDQDYLTYFEIRRFVYEHCQRDRVANGFIEFVLSMPAISNAERNVLEEAAIRTFAPSQLMFLACELNRVDLFELALTQGADVHEKSIYGDSCLHVALICGSIGVVDNVPALSPVIEELLRGEPKKLTNIMYAMYQREDVFYQKALYWQRICSIFSRIPRFSAGQAAMIWQFILSKYPRTYQPMPVQLAAVRATYDLLKKMPAQAGSGVLSLSDFSHLASSFCRVDKLGFLLKKTGVGSTYQDERGNTFLHTYFLQLIQQVTSHSGGASSDAEQQVMFGVINWVIRFAKDVLLIANQCGKTPQNLMMDVVSSSAVLSRDRRVSSVCSLVANCVQEQQDREMHTAMSGFCW